MPVAGSKWAERFGAHLVNCRREACREMLTELTDRLRNADGFDDWIALEDYAAAALAMLGYIGRHAPPSTVICELRPRRLLDLQGFESWDEAADFLMMLCGALLANHPLDGAAHERDGVLEARRYIDAHLHEDLSLVRLAGLCHFNPAYFSRLFKNATGQTLTNYIVDARVAQAKHLLESGDLKVYQVAKAVGYGSPHYFARFFKRYTGFTPEEYRGTRGKMIINENK